MPKIYKPEIDGLRAIAIILVIASHTNYKIFNFDLFEGGNLGVDIFFVISGYLITLILLKELSENKNLILTRFYKRRIKRILPALIFVIFATLPFAWNLLTPLDLENYAKSILSSLSFISNIYFYASGQKYSAKDSELIPFLHTWSLSVEEQFYIIFPIFILIIYRFYKKFLLTFLNVTLILSLIMSFILNRNYPDLEFYIFPTRAWEFLSGSILAHLEYSYKRRKIKLKHSSIGTNIGMFMIFFALFLTHALNNKLILDRVFTVVGVGMIIWFATGEELVTKALSSKYIVSIGLISYSLYLWHYPIFAFNRLSGFSEGNNYKFFILVIMLILVSIFSYWFIEKPFRKKIMNFRVVIIIISFSYLILLLINYKIIEENGFKSRVPEVFRKTLIEEPWNLLKDPTGIPCHNNINGCKFNLQSSRKVYLIGDSHMESIMSDLKDKLVQRNYQFITSTSAGCIYFPGFDLINLNSGKIHQNCSDEYFSSLKLKLSGEKNAILIFGGRFPTYLTNYYFDNKEGGVEGREMFVKYVAKGKYRTIQESFKNEVLQLSRNNKVILVYPFPEAGWDVPTKVLNSSPKDFVPLNSLKNLNNFLTTSELVFENRSFASFMLLDSIQSPNIYRVYPHTKFCSTRIVGRCLTHDENDLFYADTNHPSIRGSELINDLLIEQITKIEKERNALK